MTTPLTSLLSYRLNTRGRGRDQQALGDSGSDRNSKGNKNSAPSLLILDSVQLGFQDLNMNQRRELQPSEDLQATISTRPTGKNAEQKASKGASTRMPRRLFRLQPRASRRRGSDDFRQKLFVPGGGDVSAAPLVVKAKRAGGGTGIAWNANVYVPEKQQQRPTHSSSIIRPVAVRPVAAPTTPLVSMNITKQQKEEKQHNDQRKEQQQPKPPRYPVHQALQDLDEERTHELSPYPSSPQPIIMRAQDSDSSKFQRLRPPVPMYDSSYTNGMDTSSPSYSIPAKAIQSGSDRLRRHSDPAQVQALQSGRDRLRRQSYIGESSLPHRQAHQESEQQKQELRELQEQEQEHERSPPHMLMSMISCNHTDKTMMTADDYDEDEEDDDNTVDDDMSEVTWEGDWDFQFYQQQQYQQQQELNQYQQEQMQQMHLQQNSNSPTTISNNNAGTSRIGGTPSWNRFLRPHQNQNRERSATASTADGATTIMHTTIPSNITMVAAHRRYSD
jgi:hypothetical protein